jgi:hypothetical protein
VALPANAPKVNCTLSKPLLGEGTPGVIKSASLKIDRDLVWAATGETLYKESVPTVVEAGTGPTSGTLSFQVIPVDTPGMRDTLGNSVTNWVYTLRVIVTLPGNVERTVDYNFQPLSNQVTYDLDLVAHVNPPVVPPVIAVAVIDGGAL